MATVKTYAAVNTNSGRVENTLLWDGEAEFNPGDYLKLIELPSGSYVSIGYSYVNGEFIAPEPVPPTAEELEELKKQSQAGNVATKASLISEATLAISILQDAVDLEMATDEEASALPLWKKYRVLLSRIDANTSDDIKLPDKPAQKIPSTGQ